MVTLSFILALALSTLPPEEVLAETRLPWHLTADCPTCLGIADAWERYGTGHHDITVLVAEQRIFSDTRAAASWHAGIAPRRFELLINRGDVPLGDPTPPYRSMLDSQRGQEEGLRLLDSFTGKSGRGDLGPVRTRAEMCSFVGKVAPEGSHNHDLQMASLIGGQAYLGTSGIAPDTHIILTEAKIELDSVELLSDLVARRPEVRVVNLSQGQGRAPDDIAVESAHPHGLHYQKLSRLVMELSVAGMLGTHARSATRFLVVASAGNVPAFESNIFEPEEVLDLRIPPEAIHLAQPTPVYVDLRPHYIRDLPRLELPLLVVGAVGPKGTLPSYGRIDQGIDIYAPAGLDWLAQVRAAAPGDKSLGGAEWRECVCARLSQDNPNFAVDSVLDETCSPLKDESDWYQLGVPTLDFHSNSYADVAEFAPLRAHCADPPSGLCGSLADGSSAAAAVVSGVASLMFALDPTLSGEEAAEIVKSTARTDNVLGLPVVNPGRALDAVVHRIGARLIGALSNPTRLAAFFGTPFYYTWLDHPKPYVFTDQARAAQFVVESFSWFEPRNTWRVAAVRSGRSQRCDAGMAGSTVGIRRFLKGRDACEESENGVEILQLEIDISDGLRDLLVRTVWRRTGRLGPDTDWRVAGLSVKGELKI